MNFIRIKHFFIRFLLLGFIGISLCYVAVHSTGMKGNPGSDYRYKSSGQPAERIELPSIMEKFQGSERLVMNDRKKIIHQSMFPDKVPEDTKTFRQSLRVVMLSSQSQTGKSFLSLNLSKALAKSGSMVLLIDANLNRPTLHQILLPTMEYPPIFISGYETDPIRKGIISVCENLDFVGNFKIDEKKARENWWESIAAPELFWSVSRNYDRIIIDTHTGLNELTLSILQQADLGLMISTPDSNSLFETYTLMKAALPFLNQPELFLVINKVFEKKYGEEAQKNLRYAFRHFLQSDIKLLGMIAGDATVEFSCEDSNLLSPFCSNEKTLEKIEEIAQKVTRLTPAILSDRIV